MAGDPFPLYASVILDVSVDKRLDYGVPEEMAAGCRPGARVEVPLRGRLSRGYVLETKTAPGFPNVKPIGRLLHQEELIGPDLLKLALWMARYYCSPLQKVFKLFLPSSIRKNVEQKTQCFITRCKSKEELKQYCEKIRNQQSGQAAILDAMLKTQKGILLTELLELTMRTRAPVEALVKKGLLKKEHLKLDRSPLIDEEYFRTRPKQLNGEQSKALVEVQNDIRDNRFATHLLHGVTGSGKTEVYLQAIESALQEGKGVVMLIPEISLTPQTIERFRSRFSEPIAVLHHRLSDAEKREEWKRIKKGGAKIVIGARSAVFCPVQNLGLIILDEEHESSYKQTDEAPAYHAREVAVMRGHIGNFPVILGSATPSLESFYNAEQGKFRLHTLKNRADSAHLPDVSIVDMKKEYEKANGFTNFSEELLSGIEKRWKAGEQTILFLNRRGYHANQVCEQCGEAVACRHCDLSLTYHKTRNILECHLCGFSLSPPPPVCPSCKTGSTMKFRGVGTELIEKSLQAIFPDIRTLRVDADTTRHKGSHQKLLRAFGTGKADVMIGTQMIAKGLHFPEVTLVGVINCDAQLNIPDFRSSEIVFQLITQVSGRAGRGFLPGKVVIQTCVPDNTAIRHAANQDYPAFYEEEIAVRELFRYPPFSSLVKVSFRGKKEESVFHWAKQYRQSLISSVSKDFEIHPVIASGYAKVKDHYRFHFLIKGPGIYPVSRALEKLGSPLPSSVRMKVDVNPLSFS